MPSTSCSAAGEDLLPTEDRLGLRAPRMEIRKGIGAKGGNRDD